LGRRKSVTYAFLSVFVIFCAVVGFGLANNGVNIWGVLAVLISGATVLQIVYFITEVFIAHR